MPPLGGELRRRAPPGDAEPLRRLQGLAEDDRDRRPEGRRPTTLTASLSDRVEELFREQLESWPLLAAGVSGLAAAGTRAVRVGGAEVLVRNIPHRVASTTAAVDRESVRKRPCFLCPGNLDPREKGLPFGPDFTVYANPFPILERHLTVVHREHRPQRLEGRVGALLDLAAALPAHVVVYNGPECGASAPDHLHLQAAARDGLPLVRDAAGWNGPVIEPYGLRALLFRGPEPARLVADADRALEELSSVTGRRPEPWCNVAAWYEAGEGFTLVLFPRERHRPAAFHTGELTVSPAALDLCGLLVAPVARDFERLSGEDVFAVFREVTLAEGPFRQVVARLGRGAPGRPEGQEGEP